MPNKNAPVAESRALHFLRRSNSIQAFCELALVLARFAPFFRFPVISVAANCADRLPNSLLQLGLGLAEGFEGFLVTEIEARM